MLGNLVFTIREGEAFFIGDNVKITLVLIQGNKKTRIRVEAPKSVKILREKLKDGEKIL